MGATKEAPSSLSRRSFVEGAAVTAGAGVSVIADTEERIIALTQSGGKAQKLGVFGALSVVDVESSAQAIVENRAMISANVRASATVPPPCASTTSNIDSSASRCITTA